MSFQEELVLLLKTREPIIYVTSQEEDRVEYIIRQTLFTPKGLGYNLYIWDFVEGYKNNPLNNGYGKRNPLQALEFIENVNTTLPTVFILKDFPRFLQDISISRKIKNLIRILKREPKVILIIDPIVNIPSDLRDFITVLDFPLPSVKEIRMELLRLSKQLEFQRPFQKEVLELLVQSCRGLTLDRIRRVLTKSLIIYKQIDRRSLPLIFSEKQQIINQSQVLEFWKVNDRLKDIGGVRNLKKWILTRKTSFSEKAIEYGLPVPKGILLIGVQGSGKSLIAKALSNSWKLPLLRLDIGKVFGGVIGESESRIRNMIQIVESLAPCVLWIDEMDKAFYESDNNTDSGTTKRVLGTFITWMAEKKSPVFVVATANDIYSLPFELLRKGRFDEIFFIGLPKQPERRVIFQVHLSRLRPQTWINFDIELLSRRTNQFSGAEIEQAIIDGMHTAFNEEREFTTDDILLAIKNIIPLALTDPDRNSVLEEWSYSGRVRLA